MAESHISWVHCTVEELDGILTSLKEYAEARFKTVDTQPVDTDCLPTCRFYLRLLAAFPGRPKDVQKLHRRFWKPLFGLIMSSLTAMSESRSERSQQHRRMANDCLVYASMIQLNLGAQTRKTEPESDLDWADSFALTIQKLQSTLTLVRDYNNPDLSR